MTMLETSLWRAPAKLLSELGFNTDNGWQFRRQDVLLSVAEHWWTFRCPTLTVEKDWLQRPGLWKPNGQGTQVLDLPLAQLQLSTDSVADQERDLSGLLAWVLDSRTADWRPSVEAVQPLASLPDGALTARAGTHTCQGELHRDAGRCWIDYRLVDLPDNLPVERMAWLDAICQASERFRMVLVAKDMGGNAVHARVDLSGMAAPICDAFSVTTAARLRATVEALLPTFTFLTELGVESRALALGGPM